MMWILRRSATGVAICSLAVAPIQARPAWISTAQPPELPMIPRDGARSDIDAWREHLAYLVRDGSWWWASNAEHAAEDGLDAYGMTYSMVPGELASRGCLWGSRDGSAAAVAWHFFQGWDPGAGGPFFHQSAASGAVGMGTGWTIAGASHTYEQRFRWPDASITRLRHRATVVSADTMMTASCAWAGGDWVPQRTYTWVRRPRAPTPCS